MRIVEELHVPFTELSGCDAALTEEQRALQHNLHRFAADVLRPNGVALDKMTPEQVTAPGSLWWRTLEQFSAVGLSHDVFDGMEPEDVATLLPIAVEELAWGDAGLALGLLVAGFPTMLAHATGRRDLVAMSLGRVGCWIGTQPDRGSDLVDFDAWEVAKGCKQHRGNLIARWKGDHVELNGQSSAWVSLGPVAEVGLAQIPCDYGDGIQREDGSLNSIALLCDLTQNGVSRGKPLDKLGQRPLPQGEIFFDAVEVPAENVMYSRDDFGRSMFSMLTEGNMMMSAAFVGLARAALEHTIAYVHERRQGGARLIDHQHVRHRLYKLFEKVEAARALSRRVYQYNYCAPSPHIMYAIAAKVFCTETAVEVTNEAMQLFGGNGLTREYPLEKLMRDARAATVEDGENHTLGLVAADWLSRLYQHTRQ